MRSTGEGAASALQEPSFHLTEIPYDTARREREPSRKFSTLFHFVDGAVGKGDHFTELLPSDCSSYSHGSLASHYLSLLISQQLKPIHID
jgi:hypothetical protein